MDGITQSVHPIIPPSVHLLLSSTVDMLFTHTAEMFAAMLLLIVDMSGLTVGQVSPKSSVR